MKAHTLIRPLAALALAGWAGAGSAQSAGDACAQMAQSIPASRILLPTRGASVTSAVVVPASPPTPEYCKVLGSIAPVDPQAPVINFQINLPTQWNGKAMQFGGGGFNGVLIAGLGPAPSAPPGAPLPISRGYATFGTDSGHQTAQGVEIQAFALNDEALVNFAHASYKKTRDVARVIIQRRYGAAPAKIYYVGSSEGGREGLTMAQRYPADYDGVYSRVPVINWTGLQAAGTRSGIAHAKGGWLNPAKVALVHAAVLAACDTLDGVADGIVSAYEGCGRVFDPVTLRCPNGADTGDTCLSDAQINAVNTLHSPMRFGFSLANGVTAYPAYGYGGENDPGGWPLWWTGKTAPAVPATPDNGRQWYYGSGAVRYFIARDAKHDPLTFTPDAYAARMKEVSALMDSTDPNLGVFFARGGKLIIQENTGDYAQSPFAGIDYYKSVVAAMGQGAVDQFVRLYVTPGASHGGGGVPNNVDFVSVLEAWVERGQAPDDALVQSRQNATPPFEVTGSRPMCRYPKYPRYKGTGDPASAGSFTCS